MLPHAPCNYLLVENNCTGKNKNYQKSQFFGSSAIVTILIIKAWVINNYNLTIYTYLAFVNNALIPIIKIIHLFFIQSSSPSNPPTYRILFTINIPIQILSHKSINISQGVEVFKGSDTITNPNLLNIRIEQNIVGLHNSFV